LYAVYRLCSAPFNVVFTYSRVGGIKSKISQNLILEMGELHEKDVKEYIVSAKQIKIKFDHSSGLTCLMDKVLPVLFGEAFQVTMLKYFNYRKN
jgi:hypothetical protein